MQVKPEASWSEALVVQWLPELRDVHLLLAVEDAAVSQELTKAARRLGARIDIFAGQELTSEAIAQSGCDALFMGETWAGRPAVDLVRKLSIAAGRGHPPIVMVSRPERQALQWAALAAGCDDFATVPLDAPLLMARLANLVRRFRAEREQTRLLELVRRYVPQPARAGRIAAGIERLTATVMFTDLRGFTATSLVEDAEHIFTAVSSVLSEESDIVGRHGGYVDKFSGDGLLAVFEGPSSQVSACRAAIDIVRWAREASPLQTWKPVPIGLGVHHGVFARGDLGGENLREYTVIGGTVNVAARLCSVAQALEVVVSQEVALAVSPEIALGNARQVTLRGLAAEASVYSLDLG